MIQNNKYIIFLLIIIANIILKSIYLDATPFWYDEMISIKDTQLEFGHIKHESEWDNNPPFFYYCLWVWHSIIPISEFNARFLSVLFVSISIGLLYLFAKRYFGNKTAIASSVLLTLSNFIFFYAQEARTYSLILLLVIISTIIFFKYLREPTILNLIILSLLNFLIIYSHYIAGLVVLAQYLTILFFHKKRYATFFSIQSIIIVGLIFLRFTKKQFLNIANFNKKEDFWLEPVGIKDLASSLSELFYSPLTAIVFVGILILIMFIYLKNRDDSMKEIKLYCLMIGFFSIFILFLIGIYKPVFLSRYLIFAIPFATILVIHQLLNFKKIGVAIIVFLLGFQSYGVNLMKNNPSDYRSVAEIVSKNKRGEDIVIINTRDNLGLFLYYSYDHFLNIKTVDSICRVNKIYALNNGNLEFLRKINYEKNSKIFLVQSFHDLRGNENDFEKFFDTKDKKLFSTKFYKGVEFTIFKVL